MADAASKRKQAPGGAEGSAFKKRKVYDESIRLSLLRKSLPCPLCFIRCHHILHILKLTETVEIGGHSWKMEDTGSKGKVCWQGGNGHCA